MPEPTGPISQVSYAAGLDATQPKEDGSDWDNTWPSLSPYRVWQAVQYFNMHEFSLVVVGMLYHGGTPVSRYGRVITPTDLGNALFLPGRWGVLGGPYRGTPEEIYYNALGMREVPIKVVGAILQKIS